MRNRDWKRIRGERCSVEYRERQRRRWRRSWEKGCRFTSFLMQKERSCVGPRRRKPAEATGPWLQRWRADRAANGE